MYRDGLFIYFVLSLYIYIYIYPSASQHPPPCLFEEGYFDSGLDKVRVLFREFLSRTLSA